MNRAKSVLCWMRCNVQRVHIGMRAFTQSWTEGMHTASSFSQYGEDMILRAVFARYPQSYRGFYVDVGAHHPMRFSNTRYFYERGWSGICVDPLPEAARLFARWRPRDVFLQFGVGVTECELTYFMFAEPAFNTFTKRIADENASRVLAKQKVRVFPLSQILADHLPPSPKGGVIDFLSVDVEGMDIEVLRSNDWDLYRPRIVVIEETSGSTLAEVENLDTSIFMMQRSYRAFARIPSGLFFVDTLSPAYDGGSYLRFPNAEPSPNRGQQKK